MKKLSKMLCLVLLTITTANCAHFPSLPKQPVITLCSPVSAPEAHWVCENTETHEKTSQKLNFVQIGVGGNDWNKLQSYRKGALNDWALNHCTDAPINQRSNLQGFVSEPTQAPH